MLKVIYHSITKFEADTPWLRSAIIFEAQFVSS